MAGELRGGDRKKVLPKLAVDVVLCGGDFGWREAAVLALFAGAAGIYACSQLPDAVDAAAMLARDAALMWVVVEVVWSLGAAVGGRVVSFY